MNWADRTIRELKKGKISKCRPHGGSMRGRIESGQLVTLDPNLEPQVGDAALVRVRGNTYIHIVKAIQEMKNGKKRYLIGNNHGRINGWTTTIYGVVTEVED